MVGIAMYRLGQYRQWYDALPEESPVRDRQSFLLSMIRFQEDATGDNRKEVAARD